MSYSNEIDVAEAVFTEAIDNAIGVTGLWDGFNKRSRTLDAETVYVRGLLRRVGAERLSMGTTFLARVRGLLVAEIMVPLQRGLDDFKTIIAALQPSFLGTRSGLVFDEFPMLGDAISGQTHWKQSFAVSYYWQETVSPGSETLAVGGFVKTYVQDPNPFSAIMTAGYLDTATGLWALASNDDFSTVATGVCIWISGTQSKIAVAEQVDVVHGKGTAGQLWLSSGGAIVAQAAAPAGLFSQPLGRLAGANRALINVGEAVAS